MDPRNDQGEEPNEPVEEPVINDSIDEDASAPAPEPAPVVPEIVPADQPLLPEAPAADFSTVGTGSVFAISCSVLAFLFVLACVGFFILFRVF
jgi:hypothetical protein